MTNVLLTYLAGIPHIPKQNDVYKDMYIPKGTSIVTNVG
jgi:hypothetical protein